MIVNEIKPRGFCSGVVRALQIVKNAINDNNIKKPIYTLGLIVHNKKLSEALTYFKVISLDQTDKTRLELIDEVTSGTVILTAHGVSDLVKEKLISKNIPYIDATCKDVYKVHDHIKTHLPTHEVLYIGKPLHPEVEGVLGISKEITLITNINDAKNYLKKTNKPIYVTNQTTLSLFDVSTIVDVLKEKYDILFDNDICDATTIRQNAVINQPDADLLIVVGDSLSSNTNKLKEVSLVNNKLAYRVESIEDININWLTSISSVNVTSGASTPKAITNEVITFLKAFDKNDPTTWDTKSKLTFTDIIK